MARTEKGRGKDKIQEAVKDHKSYWVGGAGAALSSLFQQLLVDKRQVTTDQRWQFYMKKYTDDPKNGINPDHRSITSTRSNMLKELFKKRMSWKVFCKGLVFLLVDRFEIQITVTYSNGSKDIVVQKVELRDVGDDNFLIPDTGKDKDGDDDDS